MPELRKFSEMDRLEEQIAALVFESKTFFETEEELEARVKVLPHTNHTDGPLAVVLPCPHAVVLFVGCQEEGRGWGRGTQEEGSHSHHHSSTQHRMVRTPPQQDTTRGSTGPWLTLCCVLCVVPGRVWARSLPPGEGAAPLSPLPQATPSQHSGATATPTNRP